MGGGEGRRLGKGDGGGRSRSAGHGEREKGRIDGEEGVKEREREGSVSRPKRNGGGGRERRTRLTGRSVPCLPSPRHRRRRRDNGGESKSAQGEERDICLRLERWCGWSLIYRSICKGEGDQESKGVRDTRAEKL